MVSITTDEGGSGRSHDHYRIIVPEVGTAWTQHGRSVDLPSDHEAAKLVVRDVCQARADRRWYTRQRCIRWMSL
jgi:hypothetical protein